MQKKESCDSKPARESVLERFVDRVTDETMLEDLDRGVMWFTVAVFSGMVGYLAWYLWLREEILWLGFCR